MVATGYVGGDPTKVSKTGDTMSGPLILSADPTVNLQAATKHYVDSAPSSGGIPLTTVTTKGDLVVATANATVTRRGVTGVNGRVLTEDTSQADGVNWLPPAAGGMDQVYPVLGGYGLVAASGDPEDYLSQSQLGNNTIFWRRLWIPAGKSFSSVYVAVRDAGTWDTVNTGNRLCYADDSGTQIALTPVDETLWAGNGWRGGTLAGAPYTAPGTGMFIYVGLIVRGFSVQPAFALPTSANDGGGNPVWFNTGPAGSQPKRRSFFQGASSFPASFDPVTTGTATTFGPLFGVR